MTFQIQEHSFMCVISTYDVMRKYHIGNQSNAVDVSLILYAVVKVDSNCLSVE